MPGLRVWEAPDAARRDDELEAEQQAPRSAARVRSAGAGKDCDEQMAREWEEHVATRDGRRAVQNLGLQQARAGARLLPKQDSSYGT